MTHFVYETFVTGNADEQVALPLIVPLHFMGNTPKQTAVILLSGTPSQTFYNRP